MKRYILIGGNPFRGYTGTTTYTGLAVRGSADTQAEALALTEVEYDLCSGLILWIDTQTGQPGEPPGPDQDKLKFGSMLPSQKAPPDETPLLQRGGVLFCGEPQEFSPATMWSLV
jgi:hypothetical protein